MGLLHKKSNKGSKNAGSKKKLSKGHLAKKWLAKEEAKAVAESNAEWDRIRFDDNEMWYRKQNIISNGLPSTIQLKLLNDSLWAIVVEPAEGFTHLSNEVGQEEARERGDVYHVSICFNSDIDQQWKKQYLEYLQDTYGNPVQHTFLVTKITSGLTAELDPNDTVYKNCYDLWKYGWYGNKSGLHISL
jgi:hypothetical protein